MVGAVGGASRTGNDGRWWEGVGGDGSWWEWCGRDGSGGSSGSSRSGGRAWERWEIAPEPPKGDKLQVEG